ncbi:STAS domain-containing protein [Sphaerisporangium corydalis]|uniref:Anti-sigma factor antagonist n=1 Tax=Sphaerisporangium corydalis TaxID=1441875 RepID=A0ABV9E5W5_9ACTN|nr:STAS domain-containing protein [Sphaerisporangium corydalis]
MQFGADPPMGLNISYEERDSALVVQARGELDYRSAPVLRGELDHVWKVPGVSTIVLDLAEVTFCDSVGLSELIAALRRSKTTGRVLLLSGLQGTLLRVLTITGLRGAFDSHDTVEDALRHASGLGSAPPFLLGVSPGPLEGARPDPLDPSPAHVRQPENAPLAPEPALSGSAAMETPEAEPQLPPTGDGA